jgi:hypothetical protein
MGRNDSIFIKETLRYIPEELHDFLSMDYYPYNRKIMKASGLTNLPDRRTFDRRLANISVDIKERISSMGIVKVRIDSLSQVAETFIE